MIVRILEDGQYEIDAALATRLEALDADLGSAIESGDEARFEAALSAVIDDVRSSGKRLDDAAIVPSDLTLPHPSSTLAEVNGLLASGPGDEG